MIPHSGILRATLTIVVGSGAAQLIVIVVVTPLSFVLNKLWTFAAVRTHRLYAVPPHPAAEKELEHLGVDENDVV